MIVCSMVVGSVILLEANLNRKSNCGASKTMFRLQNSTLLFDGAAATVVSRCAHELESTSFTARPTIQGYAESRLQVSLDEENVPHQELPGNCIHQKNIAPDRSSTRREGRRCRTEPV